MRVYCKAALAMPAVSAYAAFLVVWCNSLVTSIRFLPRVFSILLLIFCSALVHAQENTWDRLSQPIFYSPLSSSSVIEGPVDSIIEDENGLMWLSAANGLWRWDSHFLTQVQFTSLSDFALFPQIQSAYKDQQQRIWVGTNQGLYQLDSSRNQLSAIAEEQLSAISIQNIASAQTEDGDFLVLAGDRTLFQFQVSSGRLSAISLPGSVRVYAVHIDPSDTLWVGTDKGLFYAQHEQGATGKQGKLGELQAVKSFPDNVRISAIDTTQAGKLVIGTAQHGLFVKQTSGQFSHIALQGAAQSAWIYNLVEQRDNVLLLGTFGHGLVEVDLANLTQRHVPFNRLHPAGLSDNNIWSLYRDSRGLIWIGAGESLNIYDARNTAVKHIIGGLAEPHGLPAPKTHAVVALEDSLVVANGSLGLFELSPTHGVTQSWWQAAKDPVETLYVTPDQTLYASSNFATVSLPSPDRKVIPVSVGERPASVFSGAFADTGKLFWIGGPDGLWMQSKSNPDSAKQILTNTIHDRRVSALLSTPEALWVGTWRGLYKVTLTNDGEDVSQIDTIAHAALQQQFVSDIYADSHGNIWVATSSGGVFVGASSQSSWQQLTHENGLPGNSIAAIAGESEGEIWVGTSRGIAAISTQDYQIRKVVTGRQAINSPYARGAATLTADGNAVFGGKNGLTIVTPSQLAVSDEQLALVFTNVSVLTEKGELHPIQITDTQHRFAPLPQRLSFEFAALDYLSPEHIRYRYRVPGLNESWTELDADHRNITLTSPSPGDYALHIEYSYDGKHWQSNTLNLRFTVLPAWYQSNAARIAGIVMLVIAIYVLHQLGLRHYRYRQRILEQRVAARTAELVTANQKLSEQATALEKASLTDSLTGLNNRRFLTQNIQRDLKRVQRYYIDCENQGIQPTFESDVLFLVIDLDHFKRINDTHGHQAGDAVLVETRYRLSRIFRDTDYLIRWGGEEFLAVVHNTSRREAHILAERVVTEINGCAFKINDHVRLSVSCSVGFAPYPLQQQHYNFFDWHTTVAIADAALYESKSRSRDTWTGITSIKENASEETLTLIQQQPSRVFDVAETIIRP